MEGELNVSFVFFRGVRFFLRRGCYRGWGLLGFREGVGFCVVLFWIRLGFSYTGS